MIFWRKLKEAGPEIIIYSGYGGVILKEKVLSQGKKFLHVHGGFLPQYKGSTTNYYSILNEGYITIIKRSENFNFNESLFTINDNKLFISKKIKESFDPKRIFNPGKMYREI